MSKHNYKNIAVIYGGPSSESEVSKNTANSVNNTLVELGYKTKLVEFSENLGEDLRAGKFDVIFNAMHGKYGEDGKLQGFCDVMRIPYTHSGVTASAIAMNKAFTKNILMMRNIPLIGDYFLTREELFEKQLPIPCVIKPLNEGSSLGIVIIKHEDDDVDVSKLKDDSHFLVEDYIEGREMTVAVLDGKALGIIEIKPKSGVYDYNSKYTKNASSYFTPDDLPKQIEDKLLKFAETAHNVLSCKGVTRSDFILSGNEKEMQIYFLEINTHPGMTETSLVPKIAQAKGINFDDLVEKLLDSASYSD